MKRPFACIGYTCLFTLAAAAFILKAWALVVAVLAGLVAAISLLLPSVRKAKVIPVAFFTAALSLVWYGCWFSSFQNDQRLAERDYQISGVVVEEPEKSGEKFAYILRVDSAKTAGGKEVSFSGKLRVTCVNALTAEMGDRVTGKIYTYLTGTEFQPYYAARGISLSAFLYEYDGVQVEPASQKSWFSTFRSNLEDILYTLLPEQEAGLVSGIVLGNKEGIPEEVSDTFRMAGVSHLLAVSGLHLTILAQFLMELLSLFRFPKKLSFLLMMPIVVGFMALTGFSYSILRSGIMFLLYLIAELIGRKSDGLNSLGIAVLVICLLNPFSAGDTGLLLSFSSTLGILLFSRRITGKIAARFPARLEFSRWRKPVLWVVDSAALTVSSAIFTLPISIFSFGTVSLIAPLANLLMVFPGSLLLVSGALTVIVGSFSISAALPLAFFAGLLAKYEVAVSTFLSRMPFAVVDASQAYLHLWVAGTLVLIVVLLLLPRRRKLIPIAAAGSLILLFTGALGNYFLCRERITVSSFYSDGGYHVVAEQNGQGVLLWGSIPDAYTLAQHGVAALCFTEKNVQEKKFWDNALCVEKCGEEFCTFTVYGNTMVVCGEDSDLSTLEESWRAPEFAWLEGIPQGEIAPQTAIALTREAEQAAFPHILYAEGEIQLYCGPDGAVQAGRE